MNEHYLRQVDGCKLPDSIKVMLRTREPTDDEYQEFADMLHHCQYYTVLDRIEKGEAWIAQQTEPAMVAKGWARLRELEKELDALRPREDELPCQRYAIA